MRHFFSDLFFSKLVVCKQNFNNRNGHFSEKSITGVASGIGMNELQPVMMQPSNIVGVFVL